MKILQFAAGFFERLKFYIQNIEKISIKICRIGFAVVTAYLISTLFFLIAVHENLGGIATFRAVEMSVLILDAAIACAALIFGGALFIDYLKKTEK